MSKNIIVKVKMRGEDKNEYECIGVLMEDTESHIKVAFNAQKNIVVDFIKIKRKDILDILILKDKNIKVVL